MFKIIFALCFILVVAHSAIVPISHADLEGAESARAYGYGGGYGKGFGGGIGGGYGGKS